MTTVARHRPAPARPPMAATAAGATVLQVVMGLLALLGLGLAGYMSYTDLTSNALVCGGIGDCDTVHASAYSKLLGVPVSLLGFVSYAAIAALLAARLRLGNDMGHLAALGMVVVGVSGAIFSAYLTYVELFVINAVCPWCVASAIVVTALAALALSDAHGGP